MGSTYKSNNSSTLLYRNNTTHKYEIELARQVTNKSPYINYNLELKSLQIAIFQPLEL